MSIVFETLRLQFAEGAGSARWLRWLALALWLVCTSWPARVWADASSTVDVERAVWADPTGHARFEEVLQQVFRPAPAVIARGYQVGATWLRVTVPPSTAETLWVTILPQYLDDLQVYSRPRGADGQWGGLDDAARGGSFPVQRTGAPHVELQPGAGHLIDRAHRVLRAPEQHQHPCVVLVGSYAEQRLGV